MASKVRRWLRKKPRSSALRVPFQVACSCGQVATGQRQTWFQVVTCLRCGAQVFVLPKSPLPAVGEGAGLAPSTRADAPAARFRLSPWAVPLLATGLTLALLVCVYLWVVAPWLAGPLRGGAKSAAPPAGTDLPTQLTLARKHLAAGNFRLAATGLTDALKLFDTAPASRGAVSRPELIQLHRQARLLADLAAESLEEILRHAAGVRDPDEWEADFAVRYRGKALVFDADLSQSPEGTYRVWAHGEPARLELADLALWADLPRDRPPRVLFGARLAGVRREPPGPTWVVRFDRESGVLLTDRGAVAVCCPFLGDAEVTALVVRQEKWLAGDAAEK
jgi:hypothetical protein